MLVLAFVVILAAVGILVATLDGSGEQLPDEEAARLVEPLPAPEEPETRHPEPEDVDPDDLALPEAVPWKDAPRLYLVLDDAGQSASDFQLFSQLQNPFTLAVLPELPHSSGVIREALALGHEVILHQPMEALNGEDPGPAAIYVHHSDEEIRAVLLDNLRRYPQVRGVNNHMGSRATSDARVMDAVLRTLAEEGRYFLDSRTTHTSVVPHVAHRLGLPVLARDVFLDHERSRESIEAQLDLALMHARNRGYSIVIGHVTVPMTAEVLLEREEQITAEGFVFLPLSAALERGDMLQDQGDDDSRY